MCAVDLLCTILCISDSSAWCVWVSGERMPFQEGLSKLQAQKMVRKFITRPYCEEFLEFCYKYFEVAVWSSALQKNLSLSMFSSDHGAGKAAEGGSKNLDRIKVPAPIFIWSQREITDLSPIMSFRKSTKPLYLKDLNILWAAFPSYDSSNSLLLDNDLEKCAVSATCAAVLTELS